MKQETEPVKYDKIINHAGTKITVCKNRFEVVVTDQSGINDSKLISELKAWLALHHAETRMLDGKTELNKK